MVNVFIQRKKCMERNSFEIIRDAIGNENDDKEIIDELQKYYPNSYIENNIFLIDETRKILKSTKKISLPEIELNHFLVKNGKEYIDLFSGRRFKPFTNKPYSLCHHGLCKKYKTLVLKNSTKKSRHTPSIFIAIDEKLEENKPIKIKYREDNKKQRVWEFTSYEINVCKECMDAALNERQIAIRICCPRECISKLIKHISINQKVSRSRNENNGNNKNKTKIRMGKRSTKREARRKN